MPRGGANGRESCPMPDPTRCCMCSTTGLAIASCAAVGSSLIRLVRFTVTFAIGYLHWCRLRLHDVRACKLGRRVELSLECSARVVDPSTVNRLAEPLLPLVQVLDDGRLGGGP